MLIIASGSVQASNVWQNALEWLSPSEHAETMSALRPAQSVSRCQTIAAPQTERRSSGAATCAAVAGRGGGRAMCCCCAAGAADVGVGAELLAFECSVVAMAGVALAVVEVHGFMYFSFCRQCLDDFYLLLQIPVMFDF